MYNYTTLDISTARKKISQIIDNVYFSGETYLITKRNIPLAKISKIKANEELTGKKTLDLKLFGILKDKKSSVKIASSLRKKLEKRF